MVNHSPSLADQFYNSPLPTNRTEIWRRLGMLTRTPVWTYAKFRAILVHLAAAGEGSYLPTTHQPDYVYLDGLQESFERLHQYSIDFGGVETSQAFFADWAAGSLVAGKILKGTDRETWVNLEPEAGREKWQLPVMTAHVHPQVVNQSVLSGERTAPGLSAQDYQTFLTDPRQIGMMIRYEEGTLFAMKTADTHIYLDEDKVRRRIARTSSETLWGVTELTIDEWIVRFNKAVCVEFGLTLYLAPGLRGNSAQRILVHE